jgi:hypothetical protein
MVLKKILEKFHGNERGSVDWGTILMLPVLIILLIVVYSIMPVIVDILFGKLDSSTNLYYGALIKMLIGGIGLILVIGIIWNIFNGLRQPDYGNYQ